MHKSLMILIALLAFPVVGYAQKDDRTAILNETVQYVRKAIGGDIVLDGRMRRGFAKSGKNAEILNSVAKQSAALISEPEVRCSAKGLTYFEGKQKYVSFGEPVVAGDSASVRVHWAYSYSEPVQALSTWTTEVKLRLGKQGWTAVQDVGRQSVHMGSKYCQAGK